MKKIIVLIGTLIFLALGGANALNEGHPLIYDDLNTLNFADKMQNVRSENIRKICSYEYCDDWLGGNTKAGIETFVNRYLKTLNDEEIKNTLKVKGIKITKVIIE